jgi:hypothetical protein
MALTDNQTTTKTAMRDAFTAKMEGLFPLDGNLSQADKDAIRGNWRKMGEAISEILGPLCAHITTNAAIDGQTGHIS